jgi:hypothetical protein
VIGRYYEHPGSRPRLRRADDADFDAGRSKPLVVLARRLLGRRALPVDHEAHGDALLRLADQRIGEAVADHARAEAELVDVDGGLSGLDVRQHRWIEGLSLDQDLSGGRTRLLEGECQVVQGDRARQQLLGMAPKGLVRDRDSRRASQPGDPTVREVG